jgi:hypothetical protein
MHCEDRCMTILHPTKKSSPERIARGVPGKLNKKIAAERLAKMSQVVPRPDPGRAEVGPLTRCPLPHRAPPRA